MQASEHLRATAHEILAEIQKWKFQNNVHGYFWKPLWDFPMGCKTFTLIIWLIVEFEVMIAFQFQTIKDRNKTGSSLGSLR